MNCSSTWCGLKTSMATHPMMKGLMKVVSAHVLMMLMLQCDPWSLVPFCFIDGSDHEYGNGHYPDPGVEGASAVQDVSPSPADGGVALGTCKVS